jgi:uncharacterized protein (TIGR03086 family)
VLELQSPADQIALLVSAITDDQLDAPTPCPDTPVAQLLGHVLGLSIAFRDSARKVDGPTTSTAPNASESELPPQWRDLIPQHLAELVDAWRDPDAWQGATMAGGVTMPAQVMGVVANNELVLHGWDLAVATGQPFAASPDNLQASWEMVSNTPDEPEARAGLFGPVLAVDDDAPLLERTLAHAGRDPHWAAPSPAH